MKTEGDIYIAGSRTMGNWEQTGSFPPSENVHLSWPKRIFFKQYEKTFRLSLSSPGSPPGFPPVSLSPVSH
jgi:hypothetical protein